MLLDQVSIHSWIQSNQIKTETGQPLDFHTHRYLFDPYADTSPFQCSEKGGQIGFSTKAILTAHHTCQFKGLDIGYILPTVEMVQKFVGSKVNRMAQQNSCMQESMKDKDSISQKQIGEHYIHYLGAMTDRSAIMLSLDMLIADEYDKAPQEILEIYDSRLQHSKYGYKWVFSNPTLPDFGVDRFFQISDQKKLNVTHSCGERFVFDESCIDYKKEIYFCPKCKCEITDEERRMGEWYDRLDNKWDRFKGIQTGDKWSGWWIPLWINPMIPASVISEHKRTKTGEYFSNFVAGLPYINTTNQLSQKMLDKCLNPEINDQEGRIIIGVDTGHNIHYVVTNKKGYFYNGYAMSIAENEASDTPIPNYDPYNELYELMRRFPKAIMVADQGGDLIGIRKLQAKFPGRVYLCWFTKETRNQQIIRWGENDEDGKVLVDRNRAMQLLVDEIGENRVMFWGTKEDWQPVFHHSLQIYRVKEITGDENDPQYGWKWVWKRKGGDHFFLAMTYARIGLDRWGEEAAIIMKKDMLSGIPIARTFNINQDWESQTGKSELQGIIRGIPLE